MSAANRPKSGATSTLRSTETDESRGSPSRDGGESMIAGAAGRVRDEASKAASSLASEANDKIMSLIDRQVGMGADLAEHVARSVKAAADDLDPDAPQLAGLARSAADRIEGYSSAIRDRSAGEMFQTGVEYARRQPAIVLGAAAAVGFVLFRLFDAAAASRYQSGNGHDEAFYDDSDEDSAEWAPQRRASQYGEFRGS